ncbi:MAG: hypothetical protein P4L53_23045 [Candidatus Obscuribacterales bacterium]|nr:hypothetical protein [Candidatus Obscuribacterales bacterium]
MIPRRQNRTYKRAQNGDALPFIAAIFLGVILSIILFSLSVIRMTGSHQEQKTAIEAASLAVAEDLSRIVILDPYFGFISLSDSPPIGTATEAQDQFYDHVRSINTILATVRLDMIIADRLNNSKMKALAQRDYAYALSANQRLSTTLQEAIKPGGSGVDIDGKVVTPYLDAITAYTSNIVRLNGPGAQLRPGSMKVTLGWMPGLNTNTPIPTPSSIASLQSGQSENGYYAPFMNISYDNCVFVFPAVGDTTSIADNAKFQTSPPATAYSILDIVQCQADELIDYKDEHGDTRQKILHIAACAEPSCLIDHCPNPGALELAFSNGMVAGISKLGDLLLNSSLQTSPCDQVLTPLAGDYPPSPLTPTVLSTMTDQHPSLGDVLSLTIYDWIRRQGCRFDVSSLMLAFNNQLGSRLPTTSPQKFLFEANAQGTIVQTASADNPTAANPVSQMQFKALSGLAMHTAPSQFFDVVVKDYCYQPGTGQGGLHAGEPFGGSTNVTSGGGSGLSIDENTTSTSLFPTGPASGAVRPTYDHQGIACEIRFKQSF